MSIADDRDRLIHILVVHYDMFRHKAEEVSDLFLHDKAIRETLSTLPVGAETGEVVADWRHKCAASSFHDHDGCSCSDAELRQRFAPPRSDKANGEDWSSDVTPEAVQIMRSAAAPYLAGADLEQVDGHRSTYGAMGKIDHSMLPKEGSTVIPTDRLNRVAFVGSEATAEEVRSMASEILEWRKS